MIDEYIQQFTQARLVPQFAIETQVSQVTLHTARIMQECELDRGQAAYSLAYDVLVMMENTGGIVWTKYRNWLESMKRYYPTEVEHAIESRYEYRNDL